MLRQLRFAVLVCLGIGVAFEARAEAAQTKPENVEQVKLGQSVVGLKGPWKFSVGDSPIDPKTGGPVWAEPGFDDSKWERVDLTAEKGAIDPIGGFSEYVPGWTAKGHPGYWGYAWYRIRVQLAAQPGERLALLGPADLDDAYEVFANGLVVGSFGDFSGKQPAVYYSQPAMFPFQQTIAANGKAGPATEVIAFRVWMEPNTLLAAPDAGGIHTAPLVGDAATIAADYQIRWLELTRAYAPRPVEALLFFLLAVVALTLIMFDRSDPVYLWMGAVFLFSGFLQVLTIMGAWTQATSILYNVVLSDVFVTPLLYAGWVMVWWVWFGLQRPKWLPRLVLVLTVVYMISNAIGEDLFYTLIPHPVSAAFHITSLVVRLVFLVMLVGIVMQGIREQGMEGSLVLPAVLLVGIGRFAPELNLLHVRTTWFPFGVQVVVGDLANLLLLAVLSLLLLRRLMLSLRDQRRMALDVKQAQEVQQVILPQAHAIYPGLAIESEYRPAREVGGDFFQVIPGASDGSVLIVAGDVAGKGLQAGMLVALLVGAIRTAAQYDPNPLAVLNTLNKRLIGRGEAAATCLALHITADGTTNLANAGHMPPYLNGEPLPMEGALPLGMVGNAEFSLMRFALKEGDKLVLMSDGIVEATDSNGKLFGFDRIHEMLGWRFTAAQVADAAQSFGQRDDISVISVVRTAAQVEDLTPALV